CPDLGIGYIWANNPSGSGGTRTAAPHESWGPIACSADGKKFVALAGYSPQTTSRPIYISANIWVSWITIESPNEPWQELALSSDASQLVAVVKGGGIYLWRPMRPIIATEPQGQSVLAGTNVTFSAGVFSSGPLAYQWQFGGTDMVGAT